MDNLQIAIETQRKFEFFLLGLNFGILSVAINTYHYSLIWWINIVEVAAWMFLLVGGVFGLLRWRLVPELYNKYHMKQQLEKSSHAGMSESDYMSGLKLLQSFERKTKRRHDIFWVCFILGMTLMMISRTSPVVLKMFGMA